MFTFWEYSERIVVSERPGFACGCKVVDRTDSLHEGQTRECRTFLRKQARATSILSPGQNDTHFGSTQRTLEYHRELLSKSCHGIVTRSARTARVGDQSAESLLHRRSCGQPPQSERYGLIRTWIRILQGMLNRMLDMDAAPRRILTSMGTVK
jgi:hypothetical protein